MTKSNLQVSKDRINVLATGKAGVALDVGDLVYMDSNGAYQKAQSVMWARDLEANITRKDAVGVMTTTALQYDDINPVRSNVVNGFSSLTKGALVYLSPSTAGSITQTKPDSVYVVQPVGVAISATEINFWVDPATANASIPSEGMDTPVFTGVANGAISQYDLCGIDEDGLIVKADASTGAVIVAVGVALSAISDEATGTIYDNCNIVTSGATAGTPLWTGETAGAIDTSAPSDTGDLIQPVGITVGAISLMISIGKNASLSA